MPISVRKLDKGFGQMREYRMLPRVSLTVNEAVGLLDSSLWGRLRAVRVFARYYLNPTRSLAKGDTRLTTGNALVARLRLSLADRNIPVWLESSAQRLVLEGGRVAGVEATRSGSTMCIRARKAVILAAGGFAHNQAMREKYQRPPVSAKWSAASRDDTGDAIQMGLDAGGALDFMDDAWWASTSLVPGWPKPMVSIIERNLPGSIMVNAKGKRFTNEAAPYCDVVKVQYANHWQGQRAIPAYLIMDSRFRSKYLTGPMMPGKTPKTFIDKGYIKVADTLEELAKQCGIDPEGLTAEVKKFNAGAAKGRDPDFGRGDSLLDRFYGDPSVKPNPCLRPLERRPFYAVEFWPGDIGTKGGLRADAQARVLREDGSAIDGLYAIGNCSSPVMGDSYAGGGATIASSMVFGYIAALNACRH
ncbi:MAG: FAD-binding protein [Chloroflexi bacterium]|nr:FAD-binding protein [Chloroflexota bacterium]